MTGYAGPIYRQIIPVDYRQYDVDFWMLQEGVCRDLQYRFVAQQPVLLWALTASRPFAAARGCDYHGASNQFRPTWLVTSCMPTLVKSHIQASRACTMVQCDKCLVRPAQFWLVCRQFSSCTKFGQTILNPTPSADADLADAFPIGSTVLRNRVLLAPMSGVTDLPFRKLAWKFGAGAVVSEMVASEALVNGDAEMHLKAQLEGLGIPIVQLAGREPGWMSLAARMAEANGAQIIDINMGCPARRVTSGACGSALMRDLDHALSLIEAVVCAVRVPVTLKMRLGWDEHSLNAPELARRAEAAGIAMVTVHGRTRCQFYKGKADWRAVARVRGAEEIPLVVNGDIEDRTSAMRAMSLSGADAVMVGRGAYGAPWLPGLIAAGDPDGEIGFLRELPELITEHYEAMLGFYGVEDGLRKARKHLASYLDRYAPAIDRTLRKEMLTATSPAKTIRAIRMAFSRPMLAAAA